MTAAGHGTKAKPVLKVSDALASRMPLVRAILIFLCTTVGLVLAFAPSLTDAMLLSNPDPLLFYTSFNASRHFGSLLDLQTFAFGQGFGGFQHPTILHPFWWIFVWSQSVVLSFYFAVAVLFVGTLAYFVALGGSVFFGIIAAAAACTVFFNPAFLVDFFGPVMPQCLAQIGFAYFGLAILMTAGAPFFLRVLAGLLVLAWSVIMDWPYASFLVPVIIINLTIYFFYLNGPQKALLAGMALFLTALLYFAGIYDAYDAFTLVPQRLWGISPHNDLPTSLLIFGGWPGLPFAKTFGIVAAIAVAYHIVVRRPRTWLLALVTALYVALLGVLDLNAAGPNVYWTLPTISYLERPIIPLYVILLALMINDILYLGFRMLRGTPGNISLTDLNWTPNAALAGPRLAFPATIAVCLSLPIALVVVIGTPGSKEWNSAIRRLPVRWEMSEDFVKTLGLPQSQGRDFAPYFHDNTAKLEVFNCRHLTTLSYEIFSRYCGEMLDLHSSRVFVEFHNLIDVQSGPMYAQANLLGSNPEIGTTHSYGAYKSLGIRYLALNGKLENGRHYLMGDKEVSILDLGPIDAADLSAKSVIYDGTYNVQDVIAARIAGNAVVHDRAAADQIGKLVPVESIKFGYGPDRFEVSATSSGNSLLLLPFQFSNCLSVSNADGNVSLFRVNGAQAALRFNEQATVHVLNNFRMFGDRRCRHRDFHDVFRIGLWQRQSFEQMTDGRRVPIMMRLFLQARIRQRNQNLAGDSVR
jgi:hypothetical protein